MDLDQARKLSGYKLATWRCRIRENCWAHTDFLIKQVEGQYVDEARKPKYDAVEVIVLFLLTVNMILLGIYDPLDPHSPRSVAAQWCDLSLSILFFIEALLRFLAFGHVIFLADKFNLLDVIIVLLSLSSAIVEAAGISFGNFTILRTVRVFRPLRSVTTLPALKTLVLSIYSAVKSLEDVTVLYLLFVISFSIIGVTQFMGRLMTRCVRDEWFNFSGGEPFPASSVYKGALGNRSQFLAAYPATVNFTLSDFVCGAAFEQLPYVRATQSLGCGPDATCNDAQFLGNRLLVGYTCPFGYSCLDVGNPMFGFVSFDSVPQAMLTIFVSVTAEGLYRTAYQMMDAFDVTAAYFFLAIHVFGTFFIVNLSVVLVTVTFEHVSSRIRDNQPKLVSKMQQKLAEGPRTLRRGRGKTVAGGGGGKPGKHRVVVDGVVHEVMEENAYLIPSFDEPTGTEVPAERFTSITDVAAAALAKKEQDEAEQRRRELEEARERQAARMARRQERRRRREQFRKQGLTPPPSARVDSDDTEDEATSEEEVEVEESVLVKGRMTTRKVKRMRKKQKKTAGGDGIGAAAATGTVVGPDGKPKKDGPDAWTDAMEQSETIKPMRAFVEKVMSKDGFETMLNFLIIANIGIMCTNHYGSSQALQDFFTISNIVFAVLFGLEFVIKLLHWGPKRYFVVPINVFDFCVLVLAIVDVSVGGDFPSVTALRAVRLLKVMKSFPGILRWTVVILVSVKSSFLLLCTIFVVNYCFAMFGMHMFGGKFCNLATEYDIRPDNTLDWCPNRPRANFDDVVTALLSTFTLMTGDNWDIVMYNAMRSRSPFVALAFVGYIVVMTYVLVNILVGILLSGPSPDEVDLIGQKLFGISFRQKALEQEQLEAKKREEDANALLQWQDQMKEADKGKGGVLGKIDIMGFAERKMAGMPRKFLDSLEAVEDTFLAEHASSGVNSQRKTMRRFVRDTLQSRLVENGMLLLLLVSSLALAFESPESAPDDPSSVILRILDIVFSVLFAVEIGLNFYAYGIVKEKDSYLQRDPWNILDAVLVLTNLFGTSAYFYFQTRWLKILLTVRAVRPLRFVKRSQGLRTVFSAFAMSAVPLKDVIFLAIIIWTCWGLMGVQLFMGSFYSCSNATLTTKASCLADVNTTRVWPNGTRTVFMAPTPNQWTNQPLHFDHLGASFLSLLTLASLDGGVDIMMNGIDSVGQDIAPEVNYRQRVSLFFVSFVFIGGYFLVNLIVSVIIDTYNKEKARSGDSGIFLTANQNAFLRSHRRILHGVPQIFYDDKNVSDLKRRMRIIVSQPWFRNVATGVSLLNGCLLLIDYYGAPTALRTFILIANFIFALVFSAEVAVKTISLGWKRFYRSRFNRFDLFVTVCVFVGVLGEVSFPDRGFTFVFRAMRSISLFRVVRNAERLRHVIGRFSYSLYGLANVGALLFIFLYIFGVMGVKSFGLVAYHGSITRQANFNNVFRAILLLLNALAGGGWASNMADCASEPPLCDNNINACGVFGWSQVYFILFIIFTKFVLLNMFIAVILDSFVSTDYEQLSISKEHVREFFDRWMALDPAMTLRIDSRTLVPFLRSLGPDNPLGFGGTELTRKIGHEFKFVQQLKLHEMEGTIELQDLITALCDATLGVPLPDSEIRSLQKYADRKFHRKERDLYIGNNTIAGVLSGGLGGNTDSSTNKNNSGNSVRVIERFAVHVIEQHWMVFKDRVGRRRGRIGAQSLLRSRAGNGGDGAASRRDNLSFVDGDLDWDPGAEARRRDTSSEDEEETQREIEAQLDAEKMGLGAKGAAAAAAAAVAAGQGTDGRSGKSMRTHLKETSEAKRKARAERLALERARREDPIESRPALKKYLREVAAPLLAAEEMRLRDKALEAARVKKTAAQEAAERAGLVESEALLRLMTPKAQLDWYDTKARLLEEALSKKLPLGASRLLHAERVLEQVQRDRCMHDLKEAEAAFSAASTAAPTAASGSGGRRQQPHHEYASYTNDNDADLDNDYNNPIAAAERRRAEYEREMEQKHGLLSPCKVWGKDPARVQRERAEFSLAMSPFSAAHALRENPQTAIRGTMASAALAHSDRRARVSGRPSAMGGAAEHVRLDGRESRAPVIASQKVMLPSAAESASVPIASSPPRVTLVYDEGPFVTWGGAERQDQDRLLAQERERLLREDRSNAARMRRQEEAEQELLERVAGVTTATPLHHSYASSMPSAIAAGADSPSVLLRHSPSPSTAPRKPITADDDIEIAIMLEEIREWKGERVPGKTERPPGYNSLYTHDEYKQL